MKFENLNLDVLRMIFSRACNEKWDGRNAIDSYREMVTLSSASHLWRLVVLPYLYKRIHVYCDHGKVFSNAKLAIDNGFLDYARVLKIKITDAGIEAVDLITHLYEAGIDKAIWPAIYKLDISNYDEVRFGDSNDVDLNYEENFESTPVTTKKIVDYFCKHVPGVKSVEYTDTLSMVTPNRDYEYLGMLLSELFKRYSVQIATSSMLLVPSRLTGLFNFPQHLTHLSLVMEGYEAKLLSKVFAPSLQYLNIIRCSPDITWSWFDSGNGNDIWFRSLERLLIWFSDTLTPLKSYHNGKYPARNASEFKSDYLGEGPKNVHFPVLRRLVVKGRAYPYMDGSFYKLFQDSPLEGVDIMSPQSAKDHIPVEFFASLKTFSVEVKLDPGQFRSADNPHQLPFYRKLDYTQAIICLTGPESTASDITLTANTLDTLQFFEFGWTLVQRLRLRLHVDLRSILCILGFLPTLRYYEFKVHASSLKDFCHEYIRRNKKLNLELGAVHKRVEHVAVCVTSDGQLQEDLVLYLLSELLPLAPSLLKLEVDTGAAAFAKQAYSQLASSLEGVSQQAEVVEREYWP
ncbi:hypothetical protein GGI12_001505 [Dipsacomyces acuminosporus]|nr:hypothetical protein GGI12_001505 [Dipsacomyces acuminosporus]